MASNYTENYGLCQWEATDQVLRTEFNADNAKIDAMLGEIPKKGNCQIVHGSYVGTGTWGNSSTTQMSLTFDADPLLVLIADSYVYGFLLLERGATTTRLVSYRDDLTGNVRLEWDTPNTVIWYSSMAETQANVEGRTYYYIALLAMDQ